ncbi:hypothetical protein [Leptospirillum ferriphilum]|uniref:hypothetical protein n=1 Tax=Leptospirillum ferriphilum TaxID=178606 RepID=UPI00059FB84F|nr:hypothetical protein [Leptospirillum ferriphilum]
MRDWLLPAICTPFLILAFSLGDPLPTPVVAGSVLDALPGLVINYDTGTGFIEACPDLKQIKTALKKKIAHIKGGDNNCAHDGGDLNILIVKAIDYHPFILVQYRGGLPGNKKVLWTYLPENILVDLANK